MEGAARKRRKHRWIFERVLFVCVCATVIAWQCYSRPVYPFLQTVAVEGNQKIVTEEILRMAGFHSQQGMVWFWDAKDFFTVLRDDLRVEAVTTEYEWPASLTIRVRERRSLAYVAGRYGFLDVDATGTVTTISHNLKNMEAPLITGFKAGRVFPGSRITDPAVRGALEFLVALNSETRDKLSEVHLSPNSGVTVYTVNNVKIYLGSLDHTREKARLTQDILQEISAKAIPVESVDLAHGKPVLRFRL
ncbi:MAG: FtsQ-type POTRA domain-containing protein [Veillonellaceae bacterium]|nr:FtsQ-type POTRA domain-containing protein [Veillonellaceae bacterium]